MAKDKFIIEPHFRLHEWVAEEKGYFAAAGLSDYVLSSHGLLSANHAPSSMADNRLGAYHSY